MHKRPRVKTRNHAQPPTPRPEPTRAFERGLHAIRAGHLDLAEAEYRRCIAGQADHAAAHHHLGLLAAKRGRHDEAARLLRRATELEPGNVDALGTLGTVLRHLGRLDEAVAVAEAAVALTESSAANHLALGLAQLQAGELADAERSLAQASARDPNASRAVFGHAEVLRRLGRLDEAQEICARGLALHPQDAEGLNLKGLLSDRAGRLDVALRAYEGALQGTPHDAVVLSNIAGVHLQQHDLDGAMQVARKALAIDAKNSAALGNLGTAYQRQGRTKEAIETFSKAIDIDPTCIRHYSNLSALMIAMDQPDTAIAACRLAISLAPADAESHFNLAVALRQKGRLLEAIEAYRLAFVRGCDEAIVDICHLRQQICDWAGLDEEQAHARSNTYRTGKAVAPFSILTASDDAIEHRLCAEAQAARYPRPETPLARYDAAPQPVAERRIRVGYLSCDYYEHATTSLVTQLIERHDRTRFTCFGYSYGPDDGSAMGRRVVDAFDTFVDLRTMPHLEAARRIRSDDIDILVDLKGYTQGSRTEILCYRPAPIQVNYLGYPGTMGAPFIDYLIGDPFVTPLSHAAQFSERIVQLPHCYQPNDRLRPIADSIGTRADFGLPADAFVFCSFNNSYKFNPALFAVWMRLLGAVPGAVLWLLEANALVAANLRREAAAHGIAPERLVFAPRIKMDRHVARLALADLFLDTLPINAHTTASEALWAGLPVLTCAGQAFAGRVAGSLLHAVGLPELVTDSLAAYEARALALACDPSELDAIRGTLRANRLTTPLFDIDGYARALETALGHMATLRAKGMAPEAFAVADLNR